MTLETILGRQSLLCGSLRKTFPILLAGSILGLLVACAGTMQGVVRGEGTPVTFKYEQGMDRDFYEAIIDGEQFKGQAVHADARSGVGVGVGDGTTVSALVLETERRFLSLHRRRAVIW